MSKADRCELQRRYNQTSDHPGSHSRIGHSHTSSDTTTDHHVPRAEAGGGAGSMPGDSRQTLYEEAFRRGPDEPDEQSTCKAVPTSNCSNSQEVFILPAAR